MARALAPVLAGLAGLATSTLVGLQVVAAAHVDDVSLRPVAAVAASLQSVVLVIVSWLAAYHLLQSARAPSARCRNAVFASELLTCATGAAASAVALAHLSNSRAQRPPVRHEAHLLTATSVALALAAALQLAFLILHFMSSRERIVRGGLAARGPRPRLGRVKTVPYTQTRTGGEMPLAESPAPLAMAGFFASPFAQAIRPSPSKAKLLPAGERRLSSRDSTPRGSSVDKSSFDSWDTSSVDTHNRQVVLDLSSSPPVKAGGLETIPASPMPSRSPNPRRAMTLEPPPRVRPRRSYSPNASRLRDEARPLASRSVDELHIHPLFRSDLQTPAPLASSGTSVVASPQAWQVLSRRESMQSLARMRSDSLRSPLSHQPSLESTKLKL